MRLIKRDAVPQARPCAGVLVEGLTTIEAEADALCSGSHRALRLPCPVYARRAGTLGTAAQSCNTQSSTAARRAVVCQLEWHLAVVQRPRNPHRNLVQTWVPSLSRKRCPGARC